MSRTMPVSKTQNKGAIAPIALFTVIIAACLAFAMSMPAIAKENTAKADEATMDAQAAQVAPKANSATIQKCTIQSDKTKVKVQVSIPKQVKSQDNYYYLFANNTGSNTLSSPLGKCKKVNNGKTVKSVSFLVPLNYKNSKNKLMSKFQMAVKVNGKFVPISSAKYISNPGALSTSNKAFTTGKSKKGLQFGESLPDAISLGTNYCVFSEMITDLMNTSGVTKLKYVYGGKAYYFNRDRLIQLGGLYSQIQSANMNLSVVFLLPWNSKQTDLIQPSARTQGAHNYYAWNMSTQAMRNKYAALFSCLAEWFDGKSGHGFIDNYIIGNEVNAFNQWHYTGSNSLVTNANLYADTFHVVNKAVKSRCKNARVSMSLDHSWNVNVPGKLHGSKAFLNQFATRLKEYGSPTFSIAFHAYSYPLTQADFWNNNWRYVGQSADTQYISMKNIAQMTNYVKSKYGTKTRIMLTEQGFSSHGADGQKKQAAAIAYAYYKAEFNSMIDCIIFRCQTDAEIEVVNDNLHMGLWTSNHGALGKKKASYNVFKYMDTKKCETYTKTCKQYLGINKWTQLVPGYTTKRFK